MDFSRFNTALSLVVAKCSGPNLRSKSVRAHGGATPSTSAPPTPLAKPAAEAEAASLQRMPALEVAPQVADEESTPLRKSEAPVPQAEAASLSAEAEPARQAGDSAGPVSEAFEPPLPHTDAPPMRPRRRKKLGLHTLERLIITALTRAEIGNHAADGGDGGDRAKRSMHALFSRNVLSGLQRMHTLSKVRHTSIADQQCSLCPAHV